MQRFPRAYRHGTDYEICAVRYAHLERTASHNFIGGDEHDGPMPLDYYVWTIRGPRVLFVLDTGFDAATGAARGRQLVQPVAAGLAAVGVDPAQVTDVIISHMHYDHAGNHELFPRARYHLQTEEMAFCTGRAMCHAVMRAPYEACDVQAMVGKLFAGRVVYHDGVAELAPGITLHRVGGHTRGLQVVRVHTQRGWVVLGVGRGALLRQLARAAAISHRRERGGLPRCLRNHRGARKLAAACDSGARSAGAGALPRGAHRLDRCRARGSRSAHLKRG